MLDLGRMRVLRELKLRGTLAAVADTLGYTPSAVSQQLAQLQRDVGVPVVERVGRRLRLTAAGEALAEHADVLL
ncbi:MAG: LysR family transcriptional regulator, partial [Spirillospora sp.]